jgi:type IV pilus assembly protein PilN
LWFGVEEVFTVILINLLPHREAARKLRRESFYAALGASAILGVLFSGFVYLWYQSQISNQQSRNLILGSEVKRLEIQIKDIATLQSDISALKARQQAVEDLQADRNLPVHLLIELVKQLPNGVYINSLKQENQTVTLHGVAQSNERVAEMLRNLLNNTPTVALSPREQRRVANFTVRAGLVRASEAEKTSVAASGPVQTISLTLTSLQATKAP